MCVNYTFKCSYLDTWLNPMHLYTSNHSDAMECCQFLLCKSIQCRIPGRFHWENCHPFESAPLEYHWSWHFLCNKFEQSWKWSKIRIQYFFPLEFRLKDNHRQMSTEKISSNPSDFLCGAKTVVSVPLIILHTDVWPLSAFNHVFIVLCRFHDWILPSLVMSPTPVYIANKPSCELFFCIQNNWIIGYKMGAQIEDHSHAQKMKIANFHRSFRELSESFDFWWSNRWVCPLQMDSHITECRQRVALPVSHL